MGGFGGGTGVCANLSAAGQGISKGPFPLNQAEMVPFLRYKPDCRDSGRKT